MICKVCGIEVESGDVCPACGASLVEETVEETVEVLNIDEAPADVPAVDPGAQKGKTALILGIVAIVASVICCSPFLGGLISLGCAIAAIVLASSAIKMSQEAGYENKNAKIGKILGIITIALAVIGTILSILLGVGNVLISTLGATSSSSSGYYY